MYMKSLQPHGWKDGTTVKGETFEATENEGAILQALGWAERITDAQFVEPEKPNDKADQKPAKRQYRRRNMVAQA